MAAQLATSAGSEVTAITSSPVRGDRLRGLGVARVQDRTAGRDGSADASGTYDVIVDPVAGVDLGRYIEMLRPNGRYLLCGSAGGAPALDAFGSILTTYHNSPTLFAFSLNSVGADTVGAAAAELFGRAARGELRAVVDARFPLADARRAHERLESVPVFGKITLHLNGAPVARSARRVTVDGGAGDRLTMARRDRTALRVVGAPGVDVAGQCLQDAGQFCDGPGGQADHRLLRQGAPQLLDLLGQCPSPVGELDDAGALSDGAGVRRMWPDASSLRVMIVTLGGSTASASLS
ncbi:hypothetical protein BJF90_18555 [Pseudonocardia sp. CNS-004]|nr:hypothetical protein BJF90_18555 [Pseudonocardia sp. CNS-004]